jgi:RimJ/RimL family protein N-acetyltransferase
VTRGVVLRTVVASDLPGLFEHQFDPEANQMAAFPARDRETFMAHWERLLADPSNIVRAIDCDGRLAGNIGIWGAPEERLVGYWIAREHWGKGIATAALTSLLADISDRPIFAHVAKHNVGSIRVLEKCGFKVIAEDSVALDASQQTIHEFVMRLDG